ncbi:hypothetical protein Q4566_10585 [Tamlana sp. 2_MG-2023]|uniref:hypothetical protein n=1 Tax=unclassified Tamlana TaxID=2614803 RepID=UPI0026E3FC29|nr:MULTISPECIES: hypothetical protein [unclassified Tamlana]MDO6760646.1 hypothetical protein [Tamlana sp. 2_MG-2023]MDO6790902.1 hypothetical protein [Tamlana sp. 1_MG-2023]
MKKSILSTLTMVALIVSLTACKDNTKGAEETTIEETPTEEIMVEEDIIIEENIEVEEGEVEATPPTGSTKVAGGSTADTDDSYDDVKDDETVEVEYSYTVMGKVITGSKTFTGHQDEVEASVKKLSDSLTKIDPNIKITTK